MVQTVTRPATALTGNTREETSQRPKYRKLRLVSQRKACPRLDSGGRTGHKYPWQCRSTVDREADSISLLAVAKGRTIYASQLKSNKRSMGNHCQHTNGRVGTARGQVTNPEPLAPGLVSPAVHTKRAGRK